MTRPPARGTQPWSPPLPQKATQVVSVPDRLTRCGHRPPTSRLRGPVRGARRVCWDAPHRPRMPPLADVPRLRGGQQGSRGRGLGPEDSVAVSSPPPRSPPGSHMSSAQALPHVVGVGGWSVCRGVAWSPPSLPGLSTDSSHLLRPLCLMPCGQALLHRGRSSCPKAQLL